MKRVTINIQDNSYDPVINMLKLLGKDKVEIISSEVISDADEQPLNIKIKKLLSQKKGEPFKNIKDPVKWQRDERDEWK
jgi:hypothetical protein